MSDVQQNVRVKLMRYITLQNTTDDIFVNGMPWCLMCVFLRSLIK